MKEKLPKGVTWYKQKLEKPLQVACSIGPEPHILTIESITMIGTDVTGPALPYAFCPEHKAYFGISSDVNMDGMVLKLNEDLPPAEIEEEKKHVGH
jgi:hypothetical protein